MSKIYVQIAAYRDPELIPTIQNCIEKAHNPDDLRFGIAWQHSPYDEFDDISEYLNDKRFRIIDIDFREAKGVCHARHQLNKLYRGEKYTLQLDSHHRFGKGWDTTLINMLEELKNDGHEKPLLSSYLPSYNPENDPDERLTVPWIMEFDRFAPEGPVHFLPHSIDDFLERTKPVPTRFVSGHFIFADGKFCKEVEYDPEYYFHGEEINLSVRAYMAGYDLFAPHKVFMWHEYTRDNKPKHWEDHTDWVELDNSSHRHGRELLGMDENTTELEDNVRSLRDYELYAGLEFSTRKVHRDTIDRKTPPVSTNDEDFINGLVNYQRVCIDLYKPSINTGEHDFWVVAIEDSENNEIYRQDAGPDEITQIKTDSTATDNFYHIWRNFYADNLAHKWIVWPYSEETGWGERLEGKFNVR